MTAGKKTLLYTSRKQNQKFARNIANNVDGYSSKFMTSVSLDQAQEVLAGVKGVVFVGPQTSEYSESVFSDKKDYFSFLAIADTLCVYVAGVIKKGMNFPYNNEGIGEVIKTTAKDRPEGIASRLKTFFDKNL